ncbi:LOW QUALITY PROTEIN: Pol protein [Phytophthora palmivora]|uniref:Pol protein n=1 Tax=Phytophthora palmivora TaxID=4796 RepID=A0A2P4Y243_9STRA|nr:LOW QUALITY PROTEIN: Pol protein [Phytophthora palmivora]
MYKWVAHYVKTCETCQRMKPSGHASAPLQSFLVPKDSWKSMSLDFVFGLPVDDCRLSKMVHLAPVRDKVTGKQAAQLFLDSVFRYHGLPETIVSDRDPRFTGAFWDTLFQLLGDVNCGPSADGWSDGARQPRSRRYSAQYLCGSTSGLVGPASYGCTQQCGTRINGVYPVLLERVTTPPGTANLAGRHRGLHRKGGRGSESLFQVSEIEPESLRRQLSSFLDDMLTLISRVRDTMTSAQDKQKEYSDRNARGNLNVFKQGELVMLDTKNQPMNLVSPVGSNKLKHRFIGPFAVLARHGAAYTIDLPKSMTTHPTFYVGRLKRYHDPLGLSSPTEEDQGENSPPRNEAELSGQPELPVSKPASKTQAGTHASHTKGMTVPSGKSSGKSYTHKPSGTSTPAAHKRASDHAPHGLKRLSLDGAPSRQPPKLGGQRGHGAHESHDQQHPSPDEGPLGPPACQPERQSDHQAQAQGLSRSCKHDLKADGPRRLTRTPQSSDPKLRVQKEQANKGPRTQTRARAPPALLDRNGELHYHVERVVQERRRSGKRQLLVKWRGYPSPQNSWEPEDRLRVDYPKAVEIWDLQQLGPPYGVWFPD